LSLYLDASILVALFTQEPQSERADAFLRGHALELIVSDFAEAEFASAVARRVRMGQAALEAARETFAVFDAWAIRATGRAYTTTADIASAALFIRRLDLSLRAPDAIHIAITQRVAADLFTFDERMAAAAKALGTKVVSG
jgi:predicted nucleic acid-binding protein